MAYDFGDRSTNIYNFVFERTHRLIEVLIRWSGTPRYCLFILRRRSSREVKEKTWCQQYTSIHGENIEEIS